MKKIPANLLDLLLLKGIYIPNLVPSPFTVNKGYAELIYNCTLSLRRMSFENGMKSIGVPLNNDRSLPGSSLSYYLTNLHPQGVGSKLKTCSLSNNKFERFIELGPSPTLTCMAVHTLKAKYEAKDDSTSRIRHVFCASKDQKDIYYQFEDEPDANSEPDAAAETEIPTPPPVAAAPAVVAPPVAPTTTAGPAISIEDVPIRAVDILAVIDSRKLKKQLSEIPLSKVAPSAMPLISLPAGEAPLHVVHEPTLPFRPPSTMCLHHR